MSTLPGIRRQLKNVAYNYSDAQIKVREATSNDAWLPSTRIMSEIGDLTYNTMAFTEIMQLLWKRLNDHGKNWRHVYKSLVLMDYLVRTGSEKVAQQCKENIFVIQTLKDFQHYEDNKDQGRNVREKAKQLTALLKDDERLRNERAKALMAKRRFAQNGMGIGSDGSTYRSRHTDSFSGNNETSSLPDRERTDSEMEECRPSTVGEEELQLQIALALSQEEAQKEDDLKKGDEARLQMAVQESETEYKRTRSMSENSGSAERSAIDDLLACGFVPAPGATETWDPWSSSGRSDPNAPGPSGGGPSLTPAQNSMDPWSTQVLPPPPASIHHQTSLPQTAGVDPWAPKNIGATGAGTNLTQNDPWSPSPQPIAAHHISSNMTSKENGFHQPFNNHEGHLSDLTTNSTTTDPWAMNGLKQSLPDQNNLSGDLEPGMSPMAPGAGPPGSATRNLKTPEGFLGENSSLVNLDNLIGPINKTNVPGLPPTTTKAPVASNPFSSATGPANPFLAQQRPSPTLNQMRTSQSPSVGGPGQNGGGQTWFGENSNAGNNANPAWTLQQPLQPSAAQSAVPGGATTNPFLS